MPTTSTFRFVPVVLAALCLLVLLSLVPSASFAQEVPGNGFSLGSQEVSWDCRFCGFVEMVERNGDRFRKVVFQRTAEITQSIARLFMLIWINVFVLGLLVGAVDHRQMVFTFLRRMGWCTFIAIVLSQRGSEFCMSAIDAAETVAVNLGNFLLSVVRESFDKSGLYAQFAQVEAQSAAAAVPAGTDSIDYPRLWTSVEVTSWGLVEFIAGRWKQNGSWLPFDGELLAAALLGAPYVLMTLVFGTFLAQVMFYFMVVTAVAPILVALMVFEKARTFMWSALRFLWGALLTIYFASLAMGLSASVVLNQISELSERAELRQEEWEQIQAEIGNVGIWTPVDLFISDPVMLIEIDAYAGVLDITTREYWRIFFFGFLSFLLHLAAPRIASNIAGSNDSATTAGMVVAAAQRGMGMAGRGLLNAGRWATGLLLGSTLVPQRLTNFIDRGGVAGSAWRGLGWVRNQAGEGLMSVYNRSRGMDAPGRD